MSLSSIDFVNEDFEMRVLWFLLWRAAENETHEGKRKCEALWPIFKISHQKRRYIYDLFYRRKAISRELFDFCLDQGHADKNFIAKWKKMSSFVWVGLHLLLDLPWYFEDPSGQVLDVWSSVGPVVPCWMVRFVMLIPMHCEIRHWISGTMTFGEQNSFEDACEQLNMAREEGVNFFDAAEM